MFEHLHSTWFVALLGSSLTLTVAVWLWRRHQVLRLSEVLAAVPPPAKPVSSPARGVTIRMMGWCSEVGRWARDGVYEVEHWSDLNRIALGGDFAPGRIPYVRLHMIDEQRLEEVVAYEEGFPDDDYSCVPVDDGCEPSEDGDILLPYEVRFESDGLAIYPTLNSVDRVDALEVMIDCGLAGRTQFRIQCQS